MCIFAPDLQRCRDSSCFPGNLGTQPITSTCMDVPVLLTFIHSPISLYCGVGKARGVSTGAKVSICERVSLNAMYVPFGVLVGVRLLNGSIDMIIRLRLFLPDNRNSKTQKNIKQSYFCFRYPVRDVM